MPSVTRVIGSYFPERALFQVVSAIASGVRFALVVIWYLIFKSEKSRVPLWIFIAGILRTSALGGLVYIPVKDDHDTHDLCLTVYLSLTLVWFFSLIHLSGTTVAASKAHVYRKRIARWYCVLFIPMMHYFTQYRLYQVAGGMFTVISR